MVKKIKAYTQGSPQGNAAPRAPRKNWRPSDEIGLIFSENFSPILCEKTLYLGPHLALITPASKRQPA